jgi:hypothetical protein
MWLFDMLFRLNLMHWGWQTVVVARYGERTKPALSRPPA